LHRRTPVNAKKSTFETIKIERGEGGVWLFFNRPDKRNAMSPKLNKEMLVALDPRGLTCSAIFYLPEGQGGRGWLLDPTENTTSCKRLGAQSLSDDARSNALLTAALVDGLDRHRKTKSHNEQTADPARFGVRR
jgi:hypothetical protein